MSADYPKGYFDKSRKTAPTNDDGVIYKPLPSYDGELVAAPSNLEAELDKTLAKIRLDELRRGRRARDSNFTNEQAKSQLKQLILKDVLELIGADEAEHDSDKGVFSGIAPEYRNKFRAKLRQSARKRYSDG